MTMLLALFAMTAYARVLYVSTAGLDTNPGTFELPFRTISKGYSIAAAGDTIILRGGTFVLTATTSLSKSGTSVNKYYLLAYPGEYVLLDFSGAASGARGFNLSGSYWCIRGFDFYKAPDNGMNVSGSNNTIEQCIFRENGDTGLQLGGGAANNRVINCDSYFNVDVSQGNADGFAPKLDVGTGNYFYGCRAWQNSDDGWDGYIRPRPAVVPTTTMENCWVFRNGYLKSGAASTGNGNGFKMGGSDTANLSHNVILKNCLAFHNRVKGFDQNNDRGSMTLLNCTAFSNGTNYGMSGAVGAGSVMTLKNCISAGTGGVNILASAVQATNSWHAPFVVTNDDFISVDTTGVRGPRNADGSLPTLSFIRLAAGSDLIDAGTDVGLPFNGTAPDLGCFETAGPNSVSGENVRASTFRLEQNYPNPFNPTTQIEYRLAKGGMVNLNVYDILGNEVEQLVNSDHPAGSHVISFDASGLSSGVYFYRIQAGTFSQTRKMIIAK